MVQKKTDRIRITAGYKNRILARTDLGPIRIITTELCEKSKNTLFVLFCFILANTKHSLILFHLYNILNVRESLYRE